MSLGLSVNIANQCYKLESRSRPAAHIWYDDYDIRIVQHCHSASEFIMNDIIEVEG
jgi:hypothetical protein